MSPDPLAARSADCNLLFGVLALQLDFVSRDALVRAMHAWVLDKHKPLGQILVEHSALSGDRRALLDTLVGEHLKQHANDAGQSLCALPATGAVRDELGRIADPDLQASLAQVSSTPSTAEDPYATRDQTVDGLPALRFHILRAHAKGGLGEVFVAHDVELGREVALKEIQPRHADHPESRQRFVREAEVTGRLEHPGVVPVYGLGRYADGRPFYAMRLIRGHTFKAAIERFHRDHGVDAGAWAVELRKLLARFVAVCNTVAYAHSKGVLHRDLKPSNVMLGDYGETLVVDWGLAKVLRKDDGARKPDEAAGAESSFLLPPSSLDELTQTGRVLGTPAYMSPEQAAGHPDQIGPATDVYGLGATLYHLLTGQLPFTGSGQQAHGFESDALAAPRQRQPYVPAALEAVCLKAMAPRPADRYPSAKALADALERWLAEEADQQRALVRRLLYFSRVNLADRAWHDQELARMDELLDEMWPRDGEEDLRRFEWHYLRRLRHGSFLTLRGHTAAVIRVAWSPDGTRLTSAAEDQTAKVWDAATGQELLTLSRHTGPLTNVAWSPDGKHLASAARDRTVRVWDAATGRELLTLPAPSRSGSGLSWSPDGTCLAGGCSDGTLAVWDAVTGRELRRIKAHAGAAASVAWSPDGRLLASASYDKTVKSWDASSGQELILFTADGDQVWAVAWSPDGERLAGGAADGSLRVWETGTGREALVLAGHAGAIEGVAWASDGRRLASGGHDRLVKIWDAAAGREIVVLRGHLGSVTSVAWSPDGRCVASSSEDGTVQLWDPVPRPASAALQGHAGEVQGLAWSPDGKHLASGSDDRTIKVWDAATGRELRTLAGHSGPVAAVAWSPDGRRLASASDDQTAKVWDAGAGVEALTLTGHGSPVTSVSWSPDGAHLATGSEDESVRVWDLATGQEAVRLGRGHVSSVHGVAWSPDGRRLASASYDRTVRVWDVAGQREVLLLWGHKGGVFGVAWSPDGQRLATGSFDKTVRVWDAATGQEILHLRRHAAAVMSVAWSSDGQRLASASRDESARVWDAVTGQEALTLRAPAGWLLGVAWSPDGTRLAGATKYGTVLIWGPAPAAADGR
jgi:WD40 repeat protein/serine/threonine protein kinase